MLSIVIKSPSILHRIPSRLSSLFAIVMCVLRNRQFPLSTLKLREPTFFLCNGKEKISMARLTYILSLEYKGDLEVKNFLCVCGLSLLLCDLHWLKNKCK